MRPQHNTAEDVTQLAFAHYVLKASMRPQHNTAEDLDRFKMLAAYHGSFNEAAA